MILADTSVWIDHLRSGDARLASLLEQSHILGHPFVTGELACGRIQNRALVLDLLHQLPQATVASDSEVLEFIERRALAGRGIGYVDAHLLASVALSAPARLWTRDRRLAQVAKSLGHLTPHATGKRSSR